jgi:hypothetical protein
MTISFCHLDFGKLPASLVEAMEGCDPERESLVTDSVAFFAAWPRIRFRLNSCGSKDIDADVEFRSKVPATRIDQSVT